MNVKEQTTVDHVIKERPMIYEKQVLKESSNTNLYQEKINYLKIQIENKEQEVSLWKRKYEDLVEAYKKLEMAFEKEVVNVAQKEVVYHEDLNLVDRRPGHYVVEVQRENQERVDLDRGPDIRERTDYDLRRDYQVNREYEVNRDYDIKRDNQVNREYEINKNYDIRRDNQDSNIRRDYEVVKDYASRNYNDYNIKRDYEYNNNRDFENRRDYEINKEIDIRHNLENVEAARKDLKRDFDVKNTFDMTGGKAQGKKEVLDKKFESFGNLKITSQNAKKNLDRVHKPSV